MNDLISRQAAIDALTDANIKRNVDSVCDGDLNRTRRAAQRVIAALPTVDAAPVVHCKDCKYLINGYCYSDNFILRFEEVKPDWFCADGVKKEQPTIDPVKHGRWIFVGDSEEPGDCFLMCSVCGKMYWAEDSDVVMDDANYCPNCGAKMDGKVKNNGN